MRMFLAGVVLVISAQSLHAADLCGFLDRVVASMDEKTPFSTVRYLDAPGGKCAVTNQKGHWKRGMTRAVFDKKKKFEESWGCFWNMPKMQNDADLSRINVELERIRSQFRESKDRYWNAKNDCEVYYKSYEICKRVERQHQRLIKSKKQLEIKLREKLFERKSRESDELHSRVRKLVFSINSCIVGKKIRGNWNVFRDNVEFKDKLFFRGYWWTYDPSSSNEILISSDVKIRQLRLEVWRAE